jgi:predicted O-methyltransferase YrrM
MVRSLRLAGSRDRTSRAILRALWTTAFQRISSQERVWMARIERRREQLVSDRSMISPNFVPGSAKLPGYEDVNRPLPIWGVTELISLPAGWGLFQMRLVRELGPRSCLELGTGVGISAAYQAAALELNTEGSLTTLEGSRTWGAIAEQGLSDLGLSGRVEIILGPIIETMPAAVARIAPIDYVFIDADHTEEAMVGQFQTVLPWMTSGGVLLFDDINFSEEMQGGWIAIRRDHRLSTAVSIGRMGVAVVR